MPYKNVSDLPDSVQSNLPKHAQEIYLAAFNNAWDEYAKASDRRADDNRHETAHKIAWAAVKQKYTKDDNSRWQKKEVQ